MKWLFQLHETHPVAQAVLILSLVCAAGMALGSLKLRGAGLGTAGVLFAGIIVGHFGKPVDASVLNFVKEFGLILFVFAIGLQLGPGFFAALRRQGLKLNLLAAAIVLLTAVAAPLAAWIAGFDVAAALGVFAGASINMPALGAASQTLSTLPGITDDRLALPALACAVTYPVAILGSIATLLLLRRLFGIDVQKETADYLARGRSNGKTLERRTLLITNPNLEGLRLDAIPSRAETAVSISRVQHADHVFTAANATVVHTGDRLLTIGTPSGLEQFQRVVGQPSDRELALDTADITFRNVVVTDRMVLGKTVGDLALDARFGVAVTRIARANLEMTAVPNLELRFGDEVHLVGGAAEIDRAAAVLGNSVKALNETNFIPFFIGIFLGIVVGTFPFKIAALPQPVKLGLAGGPLVVAIILGRFGRIGRLVFHMPANASVAFRDFGVALFFAAVGLQAGPTFFASVFSPIGVKWLISGLCVAVMPLLLAGAFARLVLGMSFIDLTGLLAGSTTNPPALTFATNLTGSDAPTLAYATVYPLTMLLRILAAQTLALILCR
jgi:putative transport protein